MDESGGGKGRDSLVSDFQAFEGFISMTSSIFLEKKGQMLQEFQAILLETRICWRR